MYINTLSHVNEVSTCVCKYLSVIIYIRWKLMVLSVRWRLVTLIHAKNLSSTGLLFNIRFDSNGLLQTYRYYNVLIFFYLLIKFSLNINYTVYGRNHRNWYIIDAYTYSNYWNSEKSLHRCENIPFLIARFNVFILNVQKGFWGDQNRVKCRFFLKEMLS